MLVPLGYLLYGAGSRGLGFSRPVSILGIHNIAAPCFLGLTVCGDVTRFVPLSPLTEILNMDTCLDVRGGRGSVLNE